MEQFNRPRWQRDWSGIGVGFICGVVVTIIVAVAVVKGWM